MLKNMTLSIITAVSQNNIIGGQNTLLWNLPADMKHFKDMTTGHTIVMGRKTFESIGRPLPNRRNIVVTKNVDYKAEGAEIYHSIDKALENLKNLDEEIFIIGGGEIYRQTFNIADKLYVTKIDQDFEGDTSFPDIDESMWKKISEENHEPDEKNNLSFSFIAYNKKTA